MEALIQGGGRGGCHAEVSIHPSHRNNPDASGGQACTGYLGAFDDAYSEGTNAAGEHRMEYNHLWQQGLRAALNRH